MAGTTGAGPGRWRRQPRSPWVALPPPHPGPPHGEDSAPSHQMLRIYMKWGSQKLQSPWKDRGHLLGTARTSPAPNQHFRYSAPEPLLRDLSPVVSCQASGAFLLIPAVSSQGRPSNHSALAFFPSKGHQSPSFPPARGLQSAP